MRTGDLALSLSSCSTWRAGPVPGQGSTEELALVEGGTGEPAPEDESAGELSQPLVCDGVLWVWRGMMPSLPPLHLW